MVEELEEEEVGGAGGGETSPEVGGMTEGKTEVIFLQMINTTIFLQSHVQFGKF